jgi:hypothetical protein
MVRDPRSHRRWNEAHAAPRSASSLTIVFFATPVMRTVERIEFPSTSAAKTAICVSLGDRFILTTMLDR